MELIYSQPKFKACNEPFNLRNPNVSKYLGTSNWDDLYSMKFKNSFFNFFDDIIQRKVKFLNPNPFRINYKLFSSRIVFKILHAGEDKIEQIDNKFNSNIIFLLRHPLAVTTSRKVLPRLNTFLNSDFKNNLSNKQLQYALQIANSNNFLKKGVLSWCIQNHALLKSLKSNYILITYEQMVTEPEVIIKYLAQK